VSAADLRRLIDELRQAREAAGLTQEQVAAEMEWSLSKISRIEAGAAGISAVDLRAMLDLYGVTDGVRVADLAGMARRTRGPGGVVAASVATRVSARKLAAELIVRGMEDARLRPYTPHGTDEEVEALADALLELVRRLRSATGR
jgi:transcriptional regulator with XRE-family HTH domain